MVSVGIRTQASEGTEYENGISTTPNRLIISRRFLLKETTIVMAFRQCFFKEISIHLK